MNAWDRFKVWAATQPRTTVAAIGAAGGFVLGAVLL